MRVCEKCGATNIGTSYCPLCNPEKIPVQKDKEMSVKELNLIDRPITINVAMASNLDGCVMFRIDAPHAKTIACIDRNQAHLLMLYLQEHLKPIDNYNGTNAYPDEN